MKKTFLKITDFILRCVNLISPLWRHFWVIVLLMVCLQEFSRIILAVTQFNGDYPLDKTILTHWLGIRFDLRVAIITILPMLLITLIPFLRGILHPIIASNIKIKKITSAFWALLLTLSFAIWLIIVFIDYGNVSYWRQRVDATIGNYLLDWKANIEVIWQTYPVIWLSLLLIVFLSLTFWVIYKINLYFAKQECAEVLIKHRYLRTFMAVVFSIIVVFLIHGKLSQYPLRWSDITVINNVDLEKVALNPVQQLVDTRKHRANQFDINLAKKYYPVITSWLGVEKPNDQTLSIVRPSKPQTIKDIPANANVVLIILESFSGYKSSILGNKLNPSPYIKSLADNGWVFPNFFSAHPGTARGVYSLITSIPDVALVDTGSRNFKAINHRSYIADFEGFQPFYFIGGSTSWANIRGIIQKSIPNVKIYEEGDYQKPRTDAWGLSDRNFMLEGARILSEFKNKNPQTPFFAIMQTAANHRPYTIPNDQPDFEVKNIGIDLLNENGFDSNEEYNAFRLMDHAVGKFIEESQKKTWFENTIFVLCGDHGIPHKIYAKLPHWLQRQELSAINTPLIIYSPKWFSPRRLDNLGQQADLLPTLLSLTGRKTQLRTIGRDIMQSPPSNPQGVFWIDHGGPNIGWYDGRYFTKQINGQKAKLYDLQAPDIFKDVSNENPDILKNRSEILNGYFEMNRYLMVN